MNYEELVALINHIDQSSLAYVDYQTDAHHVILSKEVPQANVQQDSVPAGDSFQLGNQPMDAPFENGNEASVVEVVDVPEEKAGEAVKSPMVGVAYLQVNPDDAAYVKVGDRVEQGDVICIVEAMKLMNEIQAPHAGIVTEILIENEEVVEYNQPLVRIES